MQSSAVLAEHLAKHPDVIVEQYAKEAGVSPHDVVCALPEGMRRFVDGARFVDVMGDVAQWGDVTLIVHTDDGIMEFGGPIPAGQVSRGYYNVPGTTGFHGHLRHDRCTQIAFVERPFMGRNSASILFFNPEGHVMFKIFVGRDANRELKADQLERFRSLPDRLSQ
ncbi:heme utilization cystosolic carrier protein HutX [Pseudorhodoplanes sp.]|jgi:putative heme utilization carrier protein HutX|uniref:heme utilization cystosolic carrier protein HutX n=1 Tax=Pseudorhodoplanes sp. TaxID=1934341 RepID=UPI002CE211F8|nr:heme utilization cystosolic carrier protein HutX [Pseudorhodoplanes sp.]HWV44050.1 heme utilization cystosolic carrier protein HutX [Pseudorhodoplanes sp.]